MCNLQHRGPAAGLPLTWPQTECCGSGRRRDFLSSITQQGSTGVAIRLTKYTLQLCKVREDYNRLPTLHYLVLVNRLMR